MNAFKFFLLVLTCKNSNVNLRSKRFVSFYRHFFYLRLHVRQKEVRFAISFI